MHKDVSRLAILSSKNLTFTEIPGSPINVCGILSEWNEWLKQISANVSVFSGFLGLRPWDGGLCRGEFNGYWSHGEMRKASWTEWEGIWELWRLVFHRYGKLRTGLSCLACIGLPVKASPERRSHHWWGRSLAEGTSRGLSAMSHPDYAPGSQGSEAGAGWGTLWRPLHSLWRPREFVQVPLCDSEFLPWSREPGCIPDPLQQMGNLWWS